MTAFYLDEDADLMAPCATATSPPAAPGTFRWAPMDQPLPAHVVRRQISLTQAYRITNDLFGRLRSLRVAPGDSIDISMDITVTE